MEGTLTLLRAKAVCAQEQPLSWGEMQNALAESWSYPAARVCALLILPAVCQC